MAKISLIYDVNYLVAALKNIPDKNEITHSSLPICAFRGSGSRPKIFFKVCFRSLLLMLTTGDISCQPIVSGSKTDR